MANENMMDLEAMAKNEMPVEEEGLPEADMGVEGAAAAEAAPAAKMVHTVDEIPELSGMGVGDTITFTITNVGEDGSYEMSIEAPEAAPGTPAGEGKRALQEALV